MKHQGIGHILHNGEKILILHRSFSNGNNCGRSLKLRKSGKEGMFLEDESDFLSDRPDIVQELKNGKVIHL